MHRTLALATIAAICGIGSAASAGILAVETFNTDGPASDYVGTGKTFSNSLGLEDQAGVQDGVLIFGYTANEGASTSGYMSMNLGSEVPLLSFQVDITPVSYFAGGFRFAASHSPDVDWIRWNPLDRAFLHFYVDQNGISIQGASAQSFSMNENHRVTVFANNSGEQQTYTGPDGLAYSLDDRSWSIFDGTTLLGQNIPAGLSENINYVGFGANRNWPGAQSITHLDNLVVADDLSVVVPEPASIMLVGMVGGVLIGSRRRVA